MKAILDHNRYTYFFLKALVSWALAILVLVCLTPIGLPPNGSMFLRLRPQHWVILCLIDQPLAYWFPGSWIPFSKPIGLMPTGWLVLLGLRPFIGYLRKICILFISPVFWKLFYVTLVLTSNCLHFK